MTPGRHSWARAALSAAVAAALAFAAPYSHAHEPTDYSALFEQTRTSVVSVSSVSVLEVSKEIPHFFFGVPPDRPRNRRSSGIGSGVILTADGYILTNAHVILEDDNETLVDKIEITTHDKKKLTAEVIGFDTYSDIALIKVEPDAPLPVAKIGDSDLVKVGNSVVAIGHPLGLNYTLTSGIVSSINRSLPGGGTERFVPFIQTDVVINPGNSGGPLLNARGEVIGINSRIIGGYTGSYIGYSLAIPINLAMEVQEKLRADGKIRRGMLGVTFDPGGITEDDAAVWGLEPGQSGVLVNSVIEGTGADAADIQPGDVIISYDNKPIRTAADFPRYIADTAPGSMVPIALIREGQKVTLDVTIGAIENRGLLTDLGTIPDENPLGMILEEVPANLLGTYEIDGGALLRGFDDTDSSVNIPQEMFKLRGGDVIIGIVIQGKLNKVDSPAALKNILSGLEVGTIGFQVIRGPRNNRPFFITVNLEN